jgi:hypothetical protein
MANVYGLAGGQVRELQSFYARNASIGTTERYRAANLAELYYLSKQYDGKKDWHDKSVPLRERKPRIIVPLFRETVEAVDRFLWSGNRFPQAVVNATREDDAAPGDDEVGPVLNTKQAEELTRFLRALIRNGKIVQCVREYTTSALKTTSAAVIVGVQAGYVNCYVHTGKDCTPTFDQQNPRTVSQLEVQYQFQRDEDIPGSTAKKPTWYWYRRVVTDQRDIVYKEVKVQPGQQPEWAEDPEKTVEHGLGFCPVVWVRTFGDCSDPIDGKPLIDPALYPMLDAISYTVSQRQRAIEYGLDPQPFRKGVPVGEREELRKNPGNVWDLPNQAEVGFLEAKGTGSDKANEHLKELTEAFREAVGVVKANPEIAAHKVSGVALSLLYGPLIALASDLRVDLGDDAYVALLGLVLRVVTAVVQDKGEDVWVPGVKSATAMLKQAQLAGVWLDPPITLKWGAFFDETEQDKQARVTYANLAVQGRMISAKRGTEHLASLFNIEDPIAEHEAIEEETQNALNQEGASLMGKKPSENPDGDEPDMDDGFEGTEAVDAVYQQLADDFEPDAIAWVKEADWEGPTEIALDEIDFANKDAWAASKHGAKVEKFARKIKGGFKKPAILIKPPDGGKYRVADGHHRVLAYQKLGKPVRAYVATVDKSGFAAAMEMHSQQKEPS